MPNIKKTELQIDHKFDPAGCRHYVNGLPYVMHCHHYMSLYTQLANDCSFIDAKKLLTETSEDTFYEVLSAYYKEHCMEYLADRITIAEKYYSAVGLGKMKIICAGPDSGEVELIHSHVEEGWIKKWGKYDKPVNFVTCGYLTAMFSAIFNKAARSYSAKEIESAVTGADKSKLIVVAN